DFTPSSTALSTLLPVRLIRSTSDTGLDDEPPTGIEELTISDVPFADVDPDYGPFSPVPSPRKRRASDDDSEEHSPAKWRKMGEELEETRERLVTAEEMIEEQREELDRAMRRGRDLQNERDALTAQIAAAAAAPPPPPIPLIIPVPPPQMVVPPAAPPVPLGNPAIAAAVAALRVRLLPYLGQGQGLNMRITGMADGSIGQEWHSITTSVGVRLRMLRSAIHTGLPRLTPTVLANPAHLNSIQGYIASANIAADQFDRLLALARTYGLAVAREHTRLGQVVRWTAQPFGDAYHEFGDQRRLPRRNAGRHSCCCDRQSTPILRRGWGLFKRRKGFEWYGGFRSPPPPRAYHSTLSIHALPVIFISLSLPASLSFSIYSLVLSRTSVSFPATVPDRSVYLTILRVFLSLFLFSNAPAQLFVHSSIPSSIYICIPSQKVSYPSHCPSTVLFYRILFLSLQVVISMLSSVSVRTDAQRRASNAVRYSPEASSRPQEVAGEEGTLGHTQGCGMLLFQGLRNYSLQHPRRRKHCPFGGTPLSTATTQARGRKKGGWSGEGKGRKEEREWKDGWMGAGYVAESWTGRRPMSGWKEGREGVEGEGMEDTEQDGFTLTHRHQMMGRERKEMDQGKGISRAGPRHPDSSQTHFKDRSD
ncbi:hypothetical protein PRIPAC_72848, partial [Pristionchus pacificus]|uniref:Uncharacterized protein n=1 Tax=Pristionchus pacificus TaxID=54126 RepID=A0A2A6CGN2_PRIPA